MSTQTENHSLDIFTDLPFCTENYNSYEGHSPALTAQLHGMTLSVGISHEEDGDEEYDIDHELYVFWEDEGLQGYAEQYAARVEDSSEPQEGARQHRLTIDIEERRLVMHMFTHES